METNSRGSTDYKTIPFRMHPRVFAALGADLVTNDVVAVIELVKNSYDAFANNVWVRFGNDPARGDYIEIEDDGEGMTEEIIKSVWCLIATPYKSINKVMSKGPRKRRVAGEKGLGRLAAARLGSYFNMLTQSPKNPCWEVEIDWTAIYGCAEFANCGINYRRFPVGSPFKKSGTKITITGLTTAWDEERFKELEQNLARLVSPFSETADFDIFIMKPRGLITEELQIETPGFIKEPKYKIKGEVNGVGDIICCYCFDPLTEGHAQKRDLRQSWAQTYDNIKERTPFKVNHKRSSCGPFNFEVRAWDIGPQDTEEISQRFGVRKNLIRNAITAHKGISVYRDGVLVLPKSDNMRDWLGLDERRVHWVGPRLSTSQIVGYVSISADDNPGLKDTSDRERFVSNTEKTEFEWLLISIVEILEAQRDSDRVKRERVKPLEDLFGSLRADDMVAEVLALAETGARADEAVPVIKAFSSALDKARSSIQERFVFYSRMATVGTIAQMLIHEIRNRTTAIGEFLDSVIKKLAPFKNKGFGEQYRLAENSVNALERLADTFSPLASRSFRRKIRHAVLEDRIRSCLMMLEGEILRKGIKCHVPTSKTNVAVDPGELDAVLLNLINNAVYWLNEVPETKREIDFRILRTQTGKRVQVFVHDTGPGVPEEDAEKVFWPGFHRKPGGIGMGLTVAAELIAEYDGRLGLKYPSSKGGASFTFDIPVI